MKYHFRLSLLLHFLLSQDGSERGGRGGSRDGDASQNRNQTASQNNMAQNQNAGGNWMQGYGQNQGWGAWNNYANQWNQYNAAAATAATQQQGGWKQAGEFCSLECRGMQSVLRI